jgi:negative elongation factor B
MNSQAALSEGPISAPTGRRSGAPLIGNVGQEFVQSALSNDPIAGINEIQARASLADPRCRPLLGLLHQLGVNRTESHKYIVQQSIEVLLSRIPTLPGERLLSLLEETFPYITIPDLRAVPLAVLDRLRPVPSTFLKQLAADREIFWELPIGVQRQAWELDKKLLRTHALSLVSAYTYETATWVQALNMDEATEPLLDDSVKTSLKKPEGLDLNEDEDHEMAEADGGATTKAAGSTGIHHKLPTLARRNLRNGSAALRQLVAMVGASPSVYRGIVDLCTVRFEKIDEEKQTQSVGMKDAALCALRSQLLMAMHDAGETSITSGDSCHKLAWTLDACVKDKMFNSRRLLELRNFFSSFIKAAEARKLLGKKRRSHTSGRRNQRSGGGDDDAESAGVPGAAAAFPDDPLRDLGAAGMVLRDPAVFHLMLHQIVRCLEKCVEVQAVPKDDNDLVFLTQLLTLAVGVRSMLREGTYDFPEADPEVLNTLYPLIADLILDAELMDADDEDDDGGGTAGNEEVEPPPEDMVFLMVKDEIGRRVVQTYALKRLAAGDLKTANRLLQAIVSFILFLFIFELSS